MKDKSKCGQVNDDHMCCKDAGHRGYHKDDTAWSATKGGAVYEWRPNQGPKRVREDA